MYQKKIKLCKTVFNGGEILPQVEELKYLGVSFMSEGKLESQSCLFIKRFKITVSQSAVQ